MVRLMGPVMSPENLNIRRSFFEMLIFLEIRSRFRSPIRSPLVSKKLGPPHTDLAIARKFGEIGRVARFGKQGAAIRRPIDVFKSSSKVRLNTCFLKTRSQNRSLSGRNSNSIFKFSNLFENGCPLNLIEIKIMVEPG